MTEWNIFDPAVCRFRLYEEPLIDTPLNRFNKVSANMMDGFTEYSDVWFVGAIVKCEATF